MANKPSALLIIVDFLLRALVLFGLVGLPLFFAEWLGWWSADGWMRTFLTAWLFIYGVGLFVVLVSIFVVVLIVLFTLIDLWASLLLASLGILPAMRHFHEACSRLGDLLIALARPLKSHDISFPLDAFRDEKF